MLLEHNDSAVIKHMEMYQGIITRMAGNSAACKQWGLPLVTAFLAYVVKEQTAPLVWLAVFAVFIFYALDAYYLMLENRFREAFNASAKKIADGEFARSDLFVLKPQGSVARFLLKAFTSPATWPVYMGMLLLLVVAYKLAGGEI
ncbi:hypothetical protein [Thiothrix nivea]|uniref:Uncharacterized protein n=1 Tax=Thiothrix nivea (strain ATCC 35100 / DSM 5205 / JP2) TaxID=870187 RepID=A0A656HLQ6_THINJ|nr:hypothetical protein [Thiothrix nivea]EIJ35945.1 hypothetical protein Thini_3433 [Thiothrix nivea DSM 5205]